MATHIKDKTENEVFELFEEFLNGIEDEGYKRLPSSSAFARFLDIPRIEVIEWEKQHPYAAPKIKAMTADTIAEGTALKKYSANAAKMILKNECDWEENPHVETQTSSDSRKVKEKEKLLDEYMEEERKKTSLKLYKSS